jgi:2-methylisocitrate lyase-like PEP mutase family enzyme
MDKFSHAAYDAVKHKLAERSGFTASRLSTGWEPAKIAELGGQDESAVEMADYYAYYRRLICSLPVDHFTKEAYCNSAVREIQGGMTDLSRVKAAMYYLAYAGLSTT